MILKIKLTRELKNSLALMILKVLTSFLGIINLKVVFSFLDLDNAALFNVAMALALWSVLLDFGLSNSIHNLVAMRINRKVTSYYVGLGFLGVIIIMTLLGLLGGKIFSFIDLNSDNITYQFINYMFQKEYLILLFCSYVLFHYSQRVLYGLGRPLLAGALIFLSSVSVFVLLNTLLNTNDSLDKVLIIWFLPYVASSVIIILYLLWLKAPESISFKKGFLSVWANRKTLQKYMLNFLYIATITSVISRIDMIYVGAHLKSEEILEYTIAFKLFLFVYFFNTALLNVFWPVIVQLYEENDMISLKFKSKVIYVSGMAYLIVATFLIYMLNDILVGFITSGKIFEISKFFICVIFVFISLRFIVDFQSVFLQAVGDFKAFKYSLPIQAGINVMGLYIILGDVTASKVVFVLIVSYITASVLYANAIYKRFNKHAN